MVHKKRSTRISTNTSNFSRRHNGAGGFSRKQVRGSEFFPDEVQRKILGIVATFENPVSVSDIEGQCRSAGYKKKDIQQKIAELERLKFLAVKKKMIFKGPLLHAAAGSVELHRDGFGFFAHDGPEDWYIRPADTRGLLNGDHMIALKVPNSSRGRAPFAVPLALSHRGSRRVVLIIEHHRRYGLVSRVLANEIKDRVSLPKDVLADLSEDDVIVAELGHFDLSSEVWSAELVECLGKITDAGIEIKIALNKFGIPGDRDVTLNAEVRNIPDLVDESSVTDRVDLRALPFVTIDGPDAKDFDDAVFVEKTENSYTLYVAIADVSHYVTENSLIDKDARKRSTSVYFPRSVFPMLPDELSSGICSLRPNEDRLVVVAKIELDSEAAVKETEFLKGVIHSNKRLTYKEVDLLFDAAACMSDVGLKPNIYESLNNLKSLTCLLLEQRKDRGALEINARESAFLFDDENNVLSIGTQTRHFAHKMIEEAMLCANVAAAEFLNERQEPFLYRVHPEPEAAKVVKLGDLLHSLDLGFEIPNRPTPTDFLKILNESIDHPAAEVVQTAVLRSMSQARYTASPTGHFGLAYERYTHFTSPIRRYPDLVVHRAIKNQLGFKYDREVDIEGLGDHCSVTERKVEEAVRWTHGWLTATVASRHVGEEHAGRIVSVASFGCFVLIEELCFEGLLHVSELGSEFFTLDDGAVAFVGSETGKTFQLGDIVEVYISQADIETGRVNLKRAYGQRGRKNVR
ncbi:MAG: ribonuclease R [Proteobacteria bacterium]|nr:ribonuclease R [Pseudomonadota bacterium]